MVFRNADRCLNYLDVSTDGFWLNYNPKLKFIAYGAQ